MSKDLQITFAKFHGLGNDFIVTRHRGLASALGRLASAITDRNTGVGADGFIVVLPPRSKKCDARVKFFNPDGSEPEMSGNGIRCVGAFLLSESRARRDLAIETEVGIKTLRKVRGDGGRWVFRVGMGTPVLEARRIPFKARGVSSPVVGFPLRTHRGMLPVTVTSMGNPHCTVFVADFAAINWTTLGREIERDQHFPNRTNVEFVKVLSRRQIEARFWERGVGQTMSSGTGSSGAVVACILNGLTERRVVVRTLAGNLEVEWPEKGEVSLTGPGERIARGTYFYRG